MASRSKWLRCSPRSTGFESRRIIMLSSRLNADAISASEAVLGKIMRLGR